MATNIRDQREGMNGVRNISSIPQRDATGSSNDTRANQSEVLFYRSGQTENVPKIHTCITCLAWSVFQVQLWRNWLIGSPCSYFA